MSIQRTTVQYVHFHITSDFRNATFPPKAGRDNRATLHPEKKDKKSRPFKGRQMYNFLKK